MSNPNPMSVIIFYQAKNPIPTYDKIIIKKVAAIQPRSAAVWQSPADANLFTTADPCPRHSRATEVSAQQGHRERCGRSGKRVAISGTPRGVTVLETTVLCLSSQDGYTVGQEYFADMIFSRIAKHYSSRAWYFRGLGHKRWQFTIVS